MSILTRKHIFTGSSQARMRAKTEGNYLAIPDHMAGDYGQVQIMKVNLDGDWNNHQLLEPTSAQVISKSGDSSVSFDFGYQLDMSGNYLITTTKGDALRQNNSAFIYKLNTSTDQWEFEYQIRADSLPDYGNSIINTGRDFGRNCCINTDRTDPTAFIIDKCGPGNTYIGFAYVFVRNSSAIWELKAIFCPYMSPWLNQTHNNGIFVATSGDHFIMTETRSSKAIQYYNLETPHVPGESGNTNTGNPITTATPTITTASGGILNGAASMSNFNFEGNSPMTGSSITSYNQRINLSWEFALDIKGNYFISNPYNNSARLQVYTYSGTGSGTSSSAKWWNGWVHDKTFSNSELGESLLSSLGGQSGIEGGSIIITSSGVFIAYSPTKNSNFLVVLKRSTPDISTSGASWAIKGYYEGGSNTDFGAYTVVLNERVLFATDNSGKVYLLEGFVPNIREEQFLGYFGLTETVLETLKTSVLALTLTPAVINLQSFSGQDLRITSGTAEQKRTKRKSLMGLIFSYNLSLNNFRVSTSNLGLDASNFGNKQNITTVRQGQIADVRQYTDAATGWYSTMENDGDTVTIRPQFGADFVVTKSGSQYRIHSTGKIVITASSNTVTLPNGTFVNTTNVGYLVDTETVTINGEPLVFGSVGGEGNDGSGAGADPYVTTLDGTFYKLDNINGCCRMLQGTLNNKNLIINVEMLKDSEIEELEMNNWAKSLNRFKLTEDCNYDQFEQSFFTKIYVEYGDSQFIYDIMKSEIILAEGSEIEMNNNITNTGSILPMYKNSIVKNTVELYCDNMCIRIMRYKNKQIRSEIGIFGGKNVENRYGFVTSPMNTDICQVNSLTDTTLIEKRDIPKFTKQIEERFETIDNKHNISKMRFIVNCY